MHVSTLVDVHDVAIAVVEDKMAPTHAVHLAGDFEIVVPTETLCPVELHHVSAASTIAEVDESIVVDVLIAQFAKSMTACLMLNHASCVEWITVGALRTESNSCSTIPHLTDATVISRIRHDDNQCLIQVVLGDSRSTQ